MAIGGSRYRRQATSRGALRAILGTCRTHRVAVDGARVAIQGFGRVGMTLAEELSAAGAKVVAIADDRQAVRNEAGIDLPRALKWMREHDAVRGLPDTEPISKADLFAMPCEILATAGLQGEITAANAGGVRARIVAEVANGATTPEADRILHENGVTVIPDILCTAGSLVLGYFEWVQDMQAFFWTDDEVSANLDRIVDDATAEVLHRADAEKLDLRGAAMMVAVDRVAHATTLRGLYP
jgi:glutamate dehydrogenase (NAD(P)+)